MLFKKKLSSTLLLLASILRINFSNSNVPTINQVALLKQNDIYYDVVKAFESVPTPSYIKYKSNLVNTLLHKATEIGDLKTIQYLVERHGADPGTVNKQGISPIDIAIYNKFDDTIAFFLEIKKKPPYYNHCTASLHDAVRNNDIIMVRFLLESGFVDINTRDNAGQTALHLAIKNNITDMTALIISNDADIHSIDKNNYTPLHYAIISKNRDIFRLLQNKFYDEFFTPDNLLAFLNYIINGDHTIKTNPGDSLNDYSKENFYVSLIVDLDENKYDIIRDAILFSILLYALGVFACQITKPNSCKLHNALDKSDLEKVKKILQSGCDVTKVDHNGVTPLSKYLELPIQNDVVSSLFLLNSSKWSIDKIQTEQMILLLQKRADIFYLVKRFPDDHECTILMHYLNEIKLFFSHPLLYPRIDVSYINKFFSRVVNESVVNHFCGENEQAIFKIPPNPTIEEQYLINLLFYYVVKHAVEPNKNLDLVELLVNNGADINFTKKSQTALHHAIINKNNKLVDYLLSDPHIDIAAENSSCQSAIHYVASLTPFVNDIFNKQIDLLLAKGADINAKDNEGNTPLLIAFKKNDVQKAKSLLGKGAERYLAYRKVTSEAQLNKFFTICNSIMQQDSPSSSVSSPQQFEQDHQAGAALR